MEWYKYCRICKTEGRNFSIDDKELSFICDYCSYGWKVEIQCNNYIQDYGKALCRQKSSISECEGTFCPRIEKITFFLIKNEQYKYTYIIREAESTHQIIHQH